MRAEDPLHAAHETELLHRGGAGEKAVGRAQKPGRVRGVLGVRRLQRPDALAEPAQQRAVLGETAKKGLTEVHVRLDEAGQDEEAVRLQEPRGRRRDDAGAEGDDPPVGDEEIAFHDAPLRVHRDQGAAADEEMAMRTRLDHGLR